MRILFVAALSALLALTGCHSRYIAATVINNTGELLSPVEVDYPSASFGTDTLASGNSYHYRFKIIGAGPTAVAWTDAEHRDYKVAGPQLHEGDEGSLSVTLGHEGSATWDMRLIHRGS